MMFAAKLGLYPRRPQHHNWRILVVATLRVMIASRNLLDYIDRYRLSRSCTTPELIGKADVTTHSDTEPNNSCIDSE